MMTAPAMESRGCDPPTGEPTTPGHYNSPTLEADGPVEPYFRDELVTIYNADSTHLQLLHDESVDLTVTSPPYNLDMSYNGYRDDVPYHAYLKWVEDWAASLLRVSTTGGRACI